MADEEGVATFSRARPVTSIRVVAEGRWERVQSVAGPGPFTVVLASACVRVTGVGAGARAYLDGRALAADSDGALVLRSVPPGEHRLVVRLADGRRLARTVAVEAGRDATAAIPPR
jgi:hypothetical protein